MEWSCCPRCVGSVRGSSKSSRNMLLPSPSKPRSSSWLALGLLGRVDVGLSSSAVNWVAEVSGIIVSAANANSPGLRKRRLMLLADTTSIRCARLADAVASESATVVFLSTCVTSPALGIVSVPVRQLMSGLCLRIHSMPRMTSMLFVIGHTRKVTFSSYS